MLLPSCSRLPFRQGERQGTVSGNHATNVGSGMLASGTGHTINDNQFTDVSDTVFKLDDAEIVLGGGTGNTYTGTPTTTICTAPYRRPRRSAGHHLTALICLRSRAAANQSAVEHEEFGTSEGRRGQFRRACSIERCRPASHVMSFVGVLGHRRADNAWPVSGRKRSWSMGGS
jgi:hypothetical protein